jgi:hypothetical protein
MKRKNTGRNNANARNLTLGIEGRELALPKLARDQRADTAEQQSFLPIDDLSLDPPVAAMALAMRRTWSTNDRLARAAWAYTLPLEWSA